MTAPEPTKLLICPGADSKELASALGEELGGGFEVTAAGFSANGERSAAGRIAEALTAIEAGAIEDRPGVVLLDGDDEATLAAALVFAKLEVPMIRMRVGGAGSQDGVLAERLCDLVLQDADPSSIATAVRERLRS